MIRKLNGQEIGDSGQFTAMITNLNPGAEVTVDILRDGQLLTVKATLGERPKNLGVRTGGPAKSRKGRCAASRCRTSHPKSVSSWVCPRT